MSTSVFLLIIIQKIMSYVSTFRNESGQNISPVSTGKKRIKEKYFWCPLLLTGTGTTKKSELDEVTHKNVI